MPDDGTFSVPNQPEAVAQVLNSLKVKANQETEITTGIDRYMRNNSSAAVAKLGDQSFIGDKYALLAASESAAEYAAKAYNANRMNLDKGKFENILGEITTTGTRLSELPKLYEFGRNKFYGIETPQGTRTITPRNAEFIDGGQLYVSDNGYYLVSVNPDGSIRGFAALSAKLPAAAKQVGYGKLKGVGKAQKAQDSGLKLPTVSNQKGETNGREKRTTVREESEVPGGMEESQGRGQESAPGGIEEKEAESTGALGQSDFERTDRVDSSAITPKEGTLERQYQDKARSEYGVKTNIIPSDVWGSEFGEDAPEFRSRNGEIYAREGFTKEEADIGFPHEITHIMKQRGFEPYLQLLIDAPDYVDFSNPQMRDVLDAALKHIGATVEDLSDDNTVNRLYDELMSTIYGLAINGKTSGNTSFTGALDFQKVFNDFDGLFQRLKSIHEEFKTWNKSRLNLPVEASKPSETTPGLTLPTAEQAPAAEPKKLALPTGATPHEETSGPLRGEAADAYIRALEAYDMEAAREEAALTVAEELLGRALERTPGRGQGADPEALEAAIREEAEKTGAREALLRLAAMPEEAREEAAEIFAERLRDTYGLEACREIWQALLGEEGEREFLRRTARGLLRGASETGNDTPQELGERLAAAVDAELRTQPERMKAYTPSQKVVDKSAGSGRINVKSERPAIKKVKNADLPNGLPIKAEPNAIIDKTDDNGTVLQRRKYGQDGMAAVDYDLTDHRRPDLHPTGAHRHLFENGKRMAWSKLTEQELIDNTDIIQRGVNYHDEE